jgi:phosphatidylinositol 3,5-bisphosphate 5-phosphatase
MARASKSQDQDVIGKLEKVAERVIKTLSFFHSGAEPHMNVIRERESADGLCSNNLHCREGPRIQSGILRTNCIDCLDRTNAAQFIIGKCAFGHQLYALGIISNPSVLFDCDAINLLNAMYHDHGDTIALQYGGSQLAHTMEVISFNPDIPQDISLDLAFTRHD